MNEIFKKVNEELETNRKMIDNLLTLFAHANEGYATCKDLAFYVGSECVDELKAAQKKLEDGFINKISDIDFDNDIVEFSIQVADGISVNIWLNINRNRNGAMPGYQSLGFKYNGRTYSTTLDVLMIVIDDMMKK